jgi:gluconate 5-dehydrogenase
LDGLVNNAAITNSGGKDMQDIAIETWDQVMAVNVRGPWLATVAAHPHLKASTSGRVVNVASDTALWGAPRLMAYVASKGAVMAMTRSMARELGPDGITVNAICPGFFPSKMSMGLIEKMGEERMTSHTPLQRLGDSEDLKGLTVLYASDAGKHITGQWLAVDGGVSAIIGG